MPFMVIYSTTDGASCHEQTDAIDEAALLVERLRNQDGIEQLRIYRMEEISFAFRPYYKVELGERPGTTPRPDAVATPLARRPTSDEPVVVHEPQPEAAVAPAPAPAPVPEPSPPAAGSAVPGDPSGANGRRGLFGR
jgi:hypothetical protein